MNVNVWMFKFFRRKVNSVIDMLENLEQVIIIMKDKEDTMVKSLDDVNAAITAVAEKITMLEVSINADVEQDKEVVRLARILIDKIKGLPNATDFTPQVDALNAQLEKLTAVNEKISADNSAVQEALNEAGTV